MRYQRLRLRSQGPDPPGDGVLHLSGDDSPVDADRGDRCTRKPARDRRAHVQEGDARAGIGVAAVDQSGLPIEPGMAEQRRLGEHGQDGPGAGPVRRSVPHRDERLVRADELGCGATERQQRLAHCRYEQQVDPGFGQGLDG